MATETNELFLRVSDAYSSIVGATRPITLHIMNDKASVCEWPAVRGGGDLPPGLEASALSITQRCRRHTSLPECRQARKVRRIRGAVQTPSPQTQKDSMVHLPATLPAN
jgi:hypothetical protein